MKKQDNVIIGIYKITNPKGKIYIGQSTDLKKREKTYSRLNCKSQPKLYNSVLKYSWEQHKFEIIEECSLDQLNEKEMYWGLQYDVLGENGLNLKLGDAKGKCSEELKIKLRTIHNNRAKIILQYDLEGNFIKEWKSINEIHRKLKYDMSGIINCLKSKNQTSAYNFQWKYYYLHYSKTIPPLKNNKLKPIYQICPKTNNILNEFYSINQAKQFLDLTSSGSGISACLLGRQNKAYGYIWRYKNN